MQPAEVVPITLKRLDASGSPVTGKLIGNFSAEIDGSALSLSAFSEIGSGWYQFSFTLPSTTGWKNIIFNVDVATEYLDPIDGISGELESIDLTALYNLAASAGGISVAEARTTGQLEDWVDDDSYTQTITIPEAALAKVGASSLADCSSILAGYKLPSSNSGDTQLGAFTVAIVSDTSGDRRISISAAKESLNLADGSDSVEYRVDVTLEKGILRHTAAQVSFNYIWQAGVV